MKPGDVPRRPNVPPHRDAGYEAVYEVIRSTPGDAWRNALIWRAVEAYRTAAEAEHERQVRANVAQEIAEPSVWPDPFGGWTADQADAARAMKDHIIRHLERGGA